MKAVTIISPAISEQVRKSVALASARTGAEFRFLMTQANLESSFNPNAKATTSTATGLYQFIDQTWLGTLKRYGPLHGLKWASDLVTTNSEGKYSVEGSKAKDAVFNLRLDPTAASLMAGELATENRQILSKKLGRPVSSIDLYIAHFLGSTGACKFLHQLEKSPKSKASDLFQSASNANPGVFYSAKGPRSVSEVHQYFKNKFEKAKVFASLDESKGTPRYTADSEVTRHRGGFKSSLRDGSSLKMEASIGLGDDLYRYNAPALLLKQYILEILNQE